MEFIKVNEHCYYFEAAVNIGYIHANGRGFLIDAGLEDAAAKKVVKHLQKHNLPLDHLFITHAHADHYGGASFLKEKFALKTWAPSLEAAILENPILEPIYLFQGTNPLKEFRNKFLEAPPIMVDDLLHEGVAEVDGVSFRVHTLPGHSYNQVGIEYQGILYAADAYFGVEQLQKHKIPFIVDVTQTLCTLEYIRNLTIKGSIPGHGTFEESPNETLQQNIDCHLEILSTLERFVIQNGTPSMDEVFQFLCRKYEVNLGQPAAYLLFRTAIGAYIANLIESEKASFEIHDYQLVIKNKL